MLAISDSLGRFQLKVNARESLSKFSFELPGYARAEAYPINGTVIHLSAHRQLMPGGISTVSLDRTPLYLVHEGTKSCTIRPSQPGELSPDWIEKIEILKDAKATAVYGSKAANGVVLIEIKKAYRKKVKFTK